MIKFLIGSVLGFVAGVIFTFFWGERIFNGILSWWVGYKVK